LRQSSISGTPEWHGVMVWPWMAADFSIIFEARWSTARRQWLVLFLIALGLAIPPGAGNPSWGRTTCADLSVLEGSLPRAFHRETAKNRSRHA
jgi:hypothetical protein